MHSSLKLGIQCLSLAVNLFYKKWEQSNICLAVSKLQLFGFLATEWVAQQILRGIHWPDTSLQPHSFKVTLKSYVKLCQSLECFVKC